MESYQASFYNLRVENGDGMLLFNGVTGALLSLPDFLRPAIEPFLGVERDRTAGVGFGSWRPPAFSPGELPEALRSRLPSLVEAGVFIREGQDEREGLRRDYDEHRTQAPLFVTMTTTLDCNMRCYYCYQKDGLLEHMSEATCDAAVAWTKDRIEGRGHTRLNVDWYGGEPMLNQAVICRYSKAMTEFCDARGLTYRASMICNGTAWPERPAAFVRENRITSVQFSLDGPERHHNKRRGLIDPKGGPGRSPSFDQVMATVGALVGSARIYLRVNVDPWIGRDCLEVLDACAERGWLGAGTDFYPYVAVVHAMTEHCGFIGKASRFEAFNAEYDEIQQAFYAELARRRGEKALEMVQYYPNRVTLNCAAVSHNSVVFGPNGLMYKCGLDVGDHHRAHDSISAALLNSSSDVAPLARDRWDRYDPFTHERCSECQYLPVCMGGCPKAQIEGNATQIRHQSAFWENNFDRVILEYFRAATRA